MDTINIHPKLENFFILGIDYYNSTILLSGYNETIVIVDLNGKILRTKRFDDVVSCTSFTSNGNVLVGVDNVIHLLDNKLDLLWSKVVEKDWCKSSYTKEIDFYIKGDYNDIVDMSSTKDGKHYFIITEDGSVHIFNSTGDYLNTINSDDAIMCRQSDIHDESCIVTIDPSRYEPDPDYCTSRYEILCHIDGSYEDMEHENIMVEDYGLITCEAGQYGYYIVQTNTDHVLFNNDASLCRLTKDRNFVYCPIPLLSEITLHKSPFYKWSPSIHTVSSDIHKMVFMLMLIRNHGETDMSCLPNELLYKVINYMV